MLIDQFVDPIVELNPMICLSPAVGPQAWGEGTDSVIFRSSAQGGAPPWECCTRRRNATFQAVVVKATVALVALMPMMQDVCI